MVTTFTLLYSMEFLPAVIVAAYCNMETCLTKIPIKIALYILLIESSCKYKAGIHLINISHLYMCISVAQTQMYMYMYCAFMSPCFY